MTGELRKHGMDTTRVRRSDGRMGLYFLTTGAGHRPSEVVYDRADSAFASARADSYDWPALLRRYRQEAARFEAEPSVTKPSRTRMVSARSPACGVSV